MAILTGDQNLNKDDTLIGGTENDSISGLTGDDFLQGGIGDDFIDGGTNTAKGDLVSYLETRNLVDLDGINVTLSGATPTTVYVRATAADSFVAEDTLVNVENVEGTKGADTLVGDGAGNVFFGNTGSDFIDGAGGSDYAIYDYLTNGANGVTVTLNGSTQVSVSVVGKATDADTLVNIENLVGGAGADTFTGDSAQNIFSGGNGADRLSGGGASDYLSGDDGNDTLAGGTGQDILTGGLGNDLLLAGGDAESSDGDLFYGDGGIDTVDFSARTTSVLAFIDNSTNIKASVENLTGGSGDDTLIGAATSNNTLKGGAGNDILIGLGGQDVFDGGSGIDQVNFSGRAEIVSVTLNGATPVTALVGGINNTLSNIENVFGGQLNDTLTGDGLANQLFGLEGNDRLSGAGGVDELNGGAGNDTLTGGADDDVISGEAGNDTIDGGSGEDTASYAEISDANTVIVATAAGAVATSVTRSGTAEDTLLNIENLTGGAGNDTLMGNELSNTLNGLGGNDLLRGLGAADVLNGGSGVDTADFSEKTVAEKVVASLAGAVATTIMVGGFNEDSLVNIENLRGGAGDDTFTGDSAANLFRGNGANDTLFGEGGTDSLFGDLGNDFLDGGDAADFLQGGSGADTLSGSNGDDILQGGVGIDNIDGGLGIDTIDFSDKVLGVTATATGAVWTTAKIRNASEDTFRNIENITGGRGGDNLTGDELANVLIGNGGNDTLAAGGGDDTLAGGSGNDVLSGMGGVDVLEGGAGVDTASFADETGAIIATAAGVSLTTVSIGGITADTLLDIENLVGGAGNDTLTGTTDANQIRGGMGNDTLFGLDGSDVLASGGGSDRLDGDAGIDTADFSDYTDPLTRIIATVVSTGTTTVNVALTSDQVTLVKIENIIGSAGDDTLSGDNIGNVLQGGAGNDTLTGNGGNDLLRGGDGVNVLVGGNGTDTADFSDRKAIVIAFTADTGATAATVGGVGVGSLLGIESLLGGTLGDSLTGDARVNRLVGNAGNDLLDGGEGNDVLEGGAGTDTVNYSSRAVSVVASSAGAAATQAVIGGTEQDLLTNIEHITGGSAADTLTGNEAANRLTGSAGNDILRGGAGGDVLAGGANDDTLSGGTGSDRLDGGLGNDLFIFDTAVNGVDIDTVVSFAGAGIAGGDALHLDDAVFTALSPGALSALAFESGTTGIATAATTRIVYDTASGGLYYDADGNAAGAAALQFATLLSKPAGLSAGDFLII